MRSLLLSALAAVLVLAAPERASATPPAHAAGAVSAAPAPRTAPAPRPPPLSKPALTPAARGADVHAPAGTLFADRVRLSAVLQGELGSCFFLSSVTALAQRRPDLVREHITELPDGTVKVRLFARPKGAPRDAPLEPVDVRITPDVPHEGGEPLYVHASDASTWPLLFEKAYAVLRGGYDRLDEGGLGFEALEALTGRPAEMVSFDRASAPSAMAKIEEAVRAGKPITAGTTSQASFGQGLRWRKEKDGRSEMVLRMTEAAGDRPKMMKLGLAPLHEYTVLGIGTKDGQKQIVLRNPWGTYTPPREGWGHGEVDITNNGVFALSYDEFAAFFSDVSIGDVPPAAPAPASVPARR